MYGFVRMKKFLYSSGGKNILKIMLKNRLDKYSGEIKWKCLN
jgi:hypothetical protein